MDSSLSAFPEKLQALGPLLLMPAQSTVWGVEPDDPLQEERPWGTGSLGLFLTTEPAEASLGVECVRYL